MSQDIVVLTASAGAFSGLAAALSEISIQLTARPLLSFEPPADWGPLDSALSRRRGYQAVALTSPRAAHAFSERLDACRVSWDDSAPAIWVVGSTTEAALQGRTGPVRKPDVAPGSDETAGGSLARAMLESDVRSPVLFPCGDRRLDELPELLRSRGIQVDEVICYRSILASREQARDAIAGSTIVVVASPSVARLLAEACPDQSRPRLVAVGTATARAAHAAGWAPAAIAAEPSTLALAAAITGLLAPR